MCVGTHRTQIDNNRGWRTGQSTASTCCIKRTKSVNIQTAKQGIFQTTLFPSDKQDNLRQQERKKPWTPVLRSLKHCKGGGELWLGSYISGCI